MQDQRPYPSRPYGHPADFYPPVNQYVLSYLVSTIQTQFWPIRDAAIRALAGSEVGFDHETISIMVWNDCVYLAAGESSIWNIPGVDEIELPASVTPWLLGWERIHDRPEGQMPVFHKFGKHNRPMRLFPLNAKDIGKIVNSQVPADYVPKPTPLDRRDAAAILLAISGMPSLTAQDVSELVWQDVWNLMRTPTLADDGLAWELSLALSEWFAVWSKGCGREGFPRPGDPVFIPTRPSDVRWHENKAGTRRPLPMSWASFRAIWKRRTLAAGITNLHIESKITRPLTGELPPTEEPY